MPASARVKLASRSFAFAQINLKLSARCCNSTRHKILPIIITHASLNALAPGLSKLPGSNAMLTACAAAALALSAYTTKRGLRNGRAFLSASMIACGTFSAPTTRSSRVPLARASSRLSTLNNSRSGFEDVSINNSVRARSMASSEIIVDASSPASASPSASSSPGADARVTVSVARRRSEVKRARGADDVRGGGWRDGTAGDRIVGRGTARAPGAVECANMPRAGAL
mmetsp:Transcript_6915/g.22775  ORF Transcript_6915/g.22775 Transcript_6915/m.22775 type:complete len:228 (+) Transcript_6915:187-870(+)